MKIFFCIYTLIATLNRNCECSYQLGNFFFSHLNRECLRPTKGLIRRFSANPSTISQKEQLHKKLQSLLIEHLIREYYSSNNREYYSI